MCVLCVQYGLDTGRSDVGSKSRHVLTDLLANIAKEHPFEWKLAPMGDAERRWFDLDHPSRKK